MMSDSDSPRMVHCVKLDQDLPGLEKAPFPTQFGQFIYEKVSKQAWDMWLAESVRYINTYRVDLSSREGTEFLLEQLRIWLGVEQGELAATAWVPPKS
jgi:Fe-S cluster biosynthesis and repair protein YggX